MRASDDNDDWLGRRTDRSVTLPPPPGWRVPRRNRNTGEGGWVPWRLMQGRDTGEGAGSVGRSGSANSPKRSGSADSRRRLGSVTPLQHHHQPETLRQGRMDPCFHVLYMNVAAEIETHQTRQRLLIFY